MVCGARNTEVDGGRETQRLERLGMRRDLELKKRGPNAIERLVAVAEEELE